MKIKMADYWWEGRKFKHPETGHMVNFKSLPLEEQKRLNIVLKGKPEPKFEESPKEPISSPRKEELHKKHILDPASLSPLENKEYFQLLTIKEATGLSPKLVREQKLPKNFIASLIYGTRELEEEWAKQVKEKGITKEVGVWEGSFGKAIQDFKSFANPDVISNKIGEMIVNDKSLTDQQQEFYNTYRKHLDEEAIFSFLNKAGRVAVGDVSSASLVPFGSAIKKTFELFMKTPKGREIVKKIRKPQQNINQYVKKTQLTEEAKKYEDEDEFIDVAYKRQVKERRRVGNSIAKKIGGKYTRKVRVPEEIAQYIGDYGSKISADGDDLYFIASSENGTIYLPNIATMKKGSGLGTKFMNALKEFADDTSQNISIYKITNAKFFKKFDWLESKNEDWEFQYMPKTDNFVGVSDLRDIWNKANKKQKAFKMKAFKIKMADITVPLDVGDEIMVGRFKNKKVVVKGFGTDDKGQPTVKTDSGEHPLLKFRIRKLMARSDAEKLKELGLQKERTTSVPEKLKILERMKGILFTKALKLISNSPRQKEVSKEIDKVWAEINKLQRSSV